MTKVYIDGQSGTTGLEIHERLEKRDDITVLKIPEEKRHDVEERRKYLNAADVVFLCLPDDSAREAAELVENPSVRVIDASTAHRTDDTWDYGFPELSKDQRERIQRSKRVANPGCHATGFIAVTAPLVAAGILPRDYPLVFFSLTGYSGGGKKMIASYEAEMRGEELDAPGIYGLTLAHKHLPEMQKMTGITYPPVFLPIVDDYYRGMAGTISLENRLLSGTHTKEDIRSCLAAHYRGQRFVSVVPEDAVPKTIYANRLAGTNRMEIFVYGSAEKTCVTAVFDNLGKGASGAAVQNMNIMLGLPEETGLI